MARVMAEMLFLCMVLPWTVLAQGGYYFSRTITLPPQMILSPVSSMPVAVNREDVKAIGMGRAQVAMGTTFNALTYNPALLAHKRLALEVPSLQASLPAETYDAVLFLQDNRSEFEQAFFLEDLRRGVDQFNVAQTNEERLRALQVVQHGLSFPRELLDHVIGPSTSPKTHGVLVIPSITGQFGNWGVSVHANLQSGFQVIQSSTLEALSAIQVPTSLDDPMAVNRALTQLNAVLQSVTMTDGSFSLDEAMPKTFAISYLDIVGTVGYGMPVTQSLSVGAALKVVNRRFSTKRMTAEAFDELLSEVRSDFTANITGLTLDLGGLYRFPGTGTEVGLSVQNIFPLGTIRSSMSARFQYSSLDYDRDQLDQIIVNQSGDTALVGVQQLLQLDLPYELALPVIVNIGARHPITPQWDVALDITDVAKQDFRYENYFDRLRIGTEYRLEAMDDMLGISGRLGMADRQWTLGVGVNLFRVLQLDAAYAHDSYVNARSYFLQARLGW
ncbi:MAG: hypothetical protein IT282_13575 [Bacteroidetes bacterium]|nr:hypothetical protein [Bacteroidota bacterium]